MKIAIRVDLSSQIGTGHFMRCLTLADELKTKNADLTFISRNLPASYIKMLEMRGMKYAPLTGNLIFGSTDSLKHSHWLGVSQTQDANETIEIMANQSWDWMIVDHYALDQRWELMIRSYASKLMVIDDLADRCHDCDVLLDQNIGRNSSDYFGLVPNSCRLFIGPNHALIREEFWKLRFASKSKKKKVNNILIFFGGMDECNFTGRTLELLTTNFFNNVSIDVVLGSENIHTGEIKRMRGKKNFNYYVQTNKMAELMQKADLYIGAGGGAILERIMMKLPSVSIAVAENQVQPLIFLSRTGSSVYLGRGEQLENEVFRQAILEALEKIDYLKNKSEELCNAFFLDRVHWSEKLLIEQ